MEQKAMRPDQWHALMLQLGQYRKKVDACFVPACSNKAVRAFLGLESGKTAFYCAECSEDIETHFYHLFVEVK